MIRRYNRPVFPSAPHPDRGGSPALALIDHLIFVRRPAGHAGLDVTRWEEDLKRTDFSTLAREHQEAVRRGVFGVPTLVWPEGRSYYVKITELVPAGRAVALYDAIETVHRFGEVIEIKTPESEGTLAA